MTVVVSPSYLSSGTAADTVATTAPCGCPPSTALVRTTSPLRCVTSSPTIRIGVSVIVIVVASSRSPSRNSVVLPGVVVPLTMPLAFTVATVALPTLHRPRIAAETSAVPTDDSAESP